jgi:diguanylate cyclase (GGDEF)-like protein/PAS domain S-box-containing protein
VGTKGLSLRARTVVLASFGVGGMLVADAAIRLHADRVAGRAGLAERAALLATIQAEALSVPLWNLDNDQVGGALDALMHDGDFASAAVVRPDGTVMVERRASDPSVQTGGATIATARPISYVDRGHPRPLGQIVVSLHTGRLEATLRREVWRHGLSLVLLLGAVLATLYLAFRQLSRPLDLLAGALSRLASGEQDVPIPALTRTDEVGAVARSLQVFKETAFQLARTQGEYRVVFDHAALGIYCRDAEGCPISVNAALLALTGYPDLEAIRGAMAAEGEMAFYAEPGRRAELAALRQSYDGYNAELCEIRRADGSLAWTSQTARAVRDAGGRLLGYVCTVEDVTESRRRLSEERLRIRAAVESAGDSMLITDIDGSPLFVNRAFTDVLGYDLEGLTAAGGLPPLLRDAVAGRRVEQVLGSGTCRIETDLMARSGRVVPMAVRVSPVVGEGGEVVGSITICTDLSDRRAAAAQIAHMAHHDSLTGLPNRVALRQRLESTLAAGGPVAVLCLDLDRFKEVNDTLGHAVGDTLLQQSAARLGAAVREGDIVARVDGDEFVVVQPRLQQSADAEAMAIRLISELSRPYRILGHEVTAGACVGIALFPQDGTEAEGLLRFGDLALYEAKTAGRGKVRRFSPEMDRVLRSRSTMERDLKSAIGEAALQVHFQPQVRLQTGRMVGAEALLRWTHPERGSIPPAEFIPLAEETGLIGPLGDWVLNAACQAAAKWSEKLRVAVNISPAQFLTGSLVSQVGAALALSGLDAARLELEITEGVMLRDSEATLDSLHALKALGVRLAMDDFGTGYSSLGYLRRMPIDKIKIDQSFIRALGREPASIALVRSIIGIGRGLGIDANAEGVETEEQALLLRQEGCHEVQGWFYGRPRPADVFAAGLLDAQARAA